MLRRFLLGALLICVAGPHLRAESPNWMHVMDLMDATAEDIRTARLALICGLRDAQWTITVQHFAALNLRSLAKRHSTAFLDGWSEAQATADGIAEGMSHAADLELREFGPTVCRTIAGSGILAVEDRLVARLRHAH